MGIRASSTRASSTSKRKTTGNNSNDENEFGELGDDPALAKTVDEISRSIGAQYIETENDKQKAKQKAKQTRAWIRAKQREAATAAAIAAIAARHAKDAEWLRKEAELRRLKLPKIKDGSPPNVAVNEDVDFEVVNTGEFAGGFKRRKTRKSKKRIVRPLKKTLSLSRSAR